MSKEESGKFYFYSMGVIISTIIIYYVINILYQNNIIGETTANILSLLIYLMPLILALFIAGIKGDTLELLRMKRRFAANSKMIVIAVFMAVLGFVGGFMIVQKYTDISIGDFTWSLVATLQTGWYTLLVGAVAVEAGFRDFCKIFLNVIIPF